MRVIYDESRTGPFWDANRGDLDLFLKGKAERESCPMGHDPEVEWLTAASNSAMVRSSPPALPGGVRGVRGVLGVLFALAAPAARLLHTPRPGPRHVCM